MSGGCSEPIADTMLLDYWLGDLDEGAAEPIEEHLLGCSLCSDRLDVLVERGGTVRAAFVGGAINLVISAPFLAAMREAGMRVRDYRLGAQESVRCTIADDDDAVIGRLAAPLAGLDRIDLIGIDAQGEVFYRLDDIPFDPASGEVLFCPAAKVLKQLPARTDIVRLVGVDEDCERRIADYVFIHTPG